MEKFLIFASRIPESKSDDSQNYISLIKALTKEFNVHFITFQTLFIDTDMMKKVKELGVNIIDFKKYKENLTIDQKLQKFFKAGYKFVYFDSIYTARYYLPFIYMYAPGIKLIMDASHSQYLMELCFTGMCKDKMKKYNILEKSKLSLEKEIPIYNYFDLVIVENNEQYENVKNELPNVKVEIIHRDIKRSGSQNIVEVFTDIKKRVSFWDISCKELEVKKVRSVNNEFDIAEYNFKIKEGTKRYVLLMPEKTVVNDDFIKRIVFSMESHYDNGIVFPISNGRVLNTTNSIVPSPEEKYNFSEFIKKHFLGNFAQWRSLNFIVEPCFLVKKSICEKIGFLDADFRTFNYSLMDFCFRIRQAGFRILANHEALIYYKDDCVTDSRDNKYDQRLLVEKWGSRTGEFLETLRV